MFAQTLRGATGVAKNVRYFRSNFPLRDGKQISTPTNTPKVSSTPDPEQVLGSKMHRCSNFDKWLLVWMKKFPKTDQVPDKVPLDVYHKVQSQARIRTANLMIVATVFGCIWAVISGKKAAKEGQSLQKANEDWHTLINKEFKAVHETGKTS